MDPIRHRRPTRERPAPRFDPAAWFDDADRAQGVLSTDRIAGHIVAEYARREAQARGLAQRHVDEEVGYSFGPLAQLAQPGSPAQRSRAGLSRRALVDGTFMGNTTGGRNLRTNLEIEQSPSQITAAQAAHLAAVREAHQRILAAALTPIERRRQITQLLRSGSVFAQVARRRPPAAGPGAVGVSALSRQGYRLDRRGQIVPVLRALRVPRGATVDALLNRGRFEFRRFDDDFDDAMLAGGGAFDAVPFDDCDGFDGCSA